MREQDYHHVRVEVVDAIAEVTFTCDAPLDASCRTYPDRDVCNCESWSDKGGKDGAGHPFKAGQPCWVIDWFDHDAVVYDGEDMDDYNALPPAEAREGGVQTKFEGDCVTWRWAQQP